MNGTPAAAIARAAAALAARARGPRMPPRIVVQWRSFCPPPPPPVRTRSGAPSRTWAGRAGWGRASRGMWWPSAPRKRTRQGSAASAAARRGTFRSYSSTDASHTSCTPACPPPPSPARVGRAAGAVGRGARGGGAAFLDHEGVAGPSGRAERGEPRA
jgi:hypothetical protein